MKILLIHQYFLEKSDGGGSRFNEISRIWSKSVQKITVIAGMVHYGTGKKKKKYQGQYFYKDKNFYPNVDILRCHVSEQYNTNFLGRMWAYFSFVFSGIWGGLFKVKDKFDIIVVSSPPLFVGIIAIALSKVKRIPYVFEVRDLWPESAIDTGVLRNKWLIRFAFWFEKVVYNNAKRINVLTPAFRDKLIEKGVPENKIIFIPNAADFSMAEKAEKDFEVKNFKKKLGLEDKFVITYVGAHGIANHLIQLIDTAELLTDTNVVFQLIGSGMEKENLVATSKNRKIKNIIFRDSVPKIEVFKYIMASDMGASVLKKVDTFKTIYSNKTFDYMSCKKPILLAIDGVSRDLIEDASCGIYVEPENANAMQKEIRKLLENPEDLKAMGINGYNYAKQYFDREKLAHRYLEELETSIRN
ncbi:glycosyltransferase family 4 protein [Membranihabitans maritimus]|uniref:glycosyltransferase family 4 protein n=1 Tax=Membranihabitans maritimus TaxID=2904244 RepID=UPI001F40DDD0